ncbi:glycosyltransferase family 2 protein [Streptomyces malaysiensis]|uniref:glycosyltransferase family 2 protein n=2 Tax=Streptomyces malaysiensis TaxID=92644 RepID=UPI0008530193|nr:MULTISPECIES: glycosyltransferase [unclassified Streptomyces]AUA15802.1 N-acetylglucosaminyl-diphospho-decaprenol L-rhamnosyltransferase [Streptomyces sp. M56]
MNAPGPAVGVVIATRDHAERLATALEHLTALPERPPVVVVDHGSTDRTRAMVAERFPQARVLAHGDGHGALARNDGVRAIGTPYVAFSDDDSWWAPGSLARAATLLNSHPRLGLLAGQVRIGPEERPDPRGATLAASPVGRAEDLPGAEVYGFLTRAAVVRRGAFLEAGGFHPLIFLGDEETLLAYDLAAMGWGVSYCPEVVALHHPSPSPHEDRTAAMRHNELISCWLRRPLPLAARRTAALLTRAGHDPAARTALRGLLTRLPAALWLRRPLPPWVEEAARRVDRQRATADEKALAAPPG